MPWVYYGRSRGAGDVSGETLLALTQLESSECPVSIMYHCSCPSKAGEQITHEQGAVRLCPVAGVRRPRLVAIVSAASGA